jgi:hypothetical protein
MMLLSVQPARESGERAPIPARGGERGAARTEGRGMQPQRVENSYPSTKRASLGTPDLGSGLGPRIAPSFRLTGDRYQAGVSELLAEISRPP